MSNIPELFSQKKRRILQDLGAPQCYYKDLSPKGSVDEGIRGLIDLINSIEGAVTTSSCAGRITVFQEGLKPAGQDNNCQIQSLVPGGKGRGGKWLFVSHDPLAEDGSRLVDRFQLHHAQVAPRGVPSHSMQPGASARFILHIMTASLHHAHLVLAAAMTAGMRESGVQSLKSLSEPNSFPMVAVRSTGIALSSVIGYYEENEKIVRSLVNEDYLETMVALANARFHANAQRIARFTKAINTHCFKEVLVWESKADRATRKRSEGLRRQEETGSTDRGGRCRCDDGSDDQIAKALEMLEK